MSNKHQRGLFDVEDRIRENSAEAPIPRLHGTVNRKALRTPIESAVIPQANELGGRPLFDVILMFMLQRLYHRSDA